MFSALEAIYHAQFTPHVFAVHTVDKFQELDI